MFVPATAVAGPLFTIETSAFALTVVITVELLLFEFGSELDDVAVAVLVSTVPFGMVDCGRTVMVNCALCGLPRSGMVQATSWPPVHVAAGPVFCTTETKVRPDGSVSLKETSVAASGPLFDSVTM